MNTFKGQRPKKITKMLTRNAFPCPGLRLEFVFNSIRPPDKTVWLDKARTCGKFSFKKAKKVLSRLFLR